MKEQEIRELNGNINLIVMELRDLNHNIERALDILVSEDTEERK